MAETELQNQTENQPLTRPVPTIPSMALEKNAMPVPPKLAAAIGVDEAIILQRLHFWLVKGKSSDYGQVVNGVRWIYNTLDDWLGQFIFFSKWRLRQALKNLRQLGLVLFSQLEKHGWKRIGYYTIDYERLNQLQVSIGLPILEVVPNEAESLKPLESSKCELPHVNVWDATHQGVTAHTSYKESDITPDIYSSSIQSASLPTAFPPQPGDGSTSGTPLKGQGASPFASLTPCPEPPPLCSTNNSHGGGMLTPPPVTTPAIDQPEFDCLDDSDSVAALAKEAAAGSNQPSYSTVQLETLKRLGVHINSAILSQISRVTSKQIDDAIACFEEDRQSWSKNKPMTNATGFFCNVLKKVKLGRSPLPKSNPIEATLALWRDRWFNPVLLSARQQMLRDIKAYFPGGEISVVNWDEGPVLGST